MSLSEPPFGAYFRVQGEDLERIRKIEAEHDALVHTVVRGRYQEIGVLDEYLFVSDKRDDREDDIESFKRNEAFAYVFNRNAPGLSEFGFIGIKPGAGAGLVRTW